MSVFGVILVRISPHSDWIWVQENSRVLENADQNNTEYQHFLRSVSDDRDSGEEECISKSEAGNLLKIQFSGIFFIKRGNKNFYE